MATWQVINHMNSDQYLSNLYNRNLLPRAHVNYLNSIKDIDPKVIYDIGSCVLHWSKPAKNVWPNARIIAFDIMEEVRHLYDQNKIEYYTGFLADEDDKNTTFYKNLMGPGGQSFFLENPQLNSAAPHYYNESTKIPVKTITLDTLVERNNLPLPDLIKMDTQGSELMILKGATKTISQCKDIILELQEVDWNIGAPKAAEVIAYMTSIGYECITQKFSKNVADADYHFRKIA